MRVRASLASTMAAIGVAGAASGRPSQWVAALRGRAGQRRRRFLMRRVRASCRARAATAGSFESILLFASVLHALAESWGRRRRQTRRTAGAVDRVRGRKLAIRSATSARACLQRHHATPLRRKLPAPPAGRSDARSSRGARRAPDTVKNEAFPHAPRAAVGEHGVAAARRRKQQ